MMSSADRHRRKRQHRGRRAT